MMTKTITIILVVLFVLPIAAGLSTGLNKIAKVGLCLVVLGFGGILLARFLYPHFLAPLVGEVADRNFLVRSCLLVAMETGLWVGGIGAAFVSLGSVVRTWQFRKKLFPFLFPPAS